MKNQIEFTQHIIKDSNKKILNPSKPLFTEIGIDKLMNMLSVEIKSLWRELAPDVYFSYSDFFSKDQLQALTDHPSKEISDESFNCLLN